MNEFEPADVIISGSYTPGDRIATVDWSHVCSARFGSTSRYDIFRNCLNGMLAMRWQSGLGLGWLVCHDYTKSGRSSLLLTIAANPNESERWDACHFLCEATSAARIAGAVAERRELTRAFVEGRMKKRKVRGEDSYKVTIGDYRNAPSGMGPLANQWRDKPHRLIYDLCSEVERLTK
jgi:hypothetical protein